MGLEGLAVDGDGFQEGREVAAEHSLGGRRLHRFPAIDLPEALVIEEKEGLVFAVVQPGNAHRPPDARAEVVLGVHGLGCCVGTENGVLVIVEPAVGIQDAVLEQIVSRAVKVVCSWLGGEIDHAAACASKLSVEGVRHDLEFGDGLDAEAIGDLHVGRGKLGGGAVEQDVASALLSAAELKGSGGWRGGVVGHSTGESGRERCELERVTDLTAEGQRKRFQYLRRHGEADIRGFGLQVRGVAGHSHAGLSGADLQLSRDGGSAGNLHDDADLLETRETGSVDFQCVRSRLKLRKRKQPLGARSADVPAAGIDLS